MLTCSQCGHPLPDPSNDYGLTPSGDIIFAAVKRAGRAGITRQRLEILLYGDDVPDSSRSSVHAIVFRNNKRLAPHGLRIRAPRGRNWDNRYRLELIEPFNPHEDIRKSVAVGFEAIRARQAAGGPGWEP